MRHSVAAAFSAFTAHFEGATTWLYLDVRGLVTIARGNLVEPIAAVDDLPLLYPSGAPAGYTDRRAAWSAVKARVDLATHGGGAFRAVSELELSAEGVDLVTRRRLAICDRDMRARWPAWEDWPADAQLGTLSDAWAAGDEAIEHRWPRLGAALDACDWTTAAIESHLDERGNRGVAPRNVAGRILYSNAAQVAARGLDPSVLYWPSDLAATADTDPALLEECAPSSQP